MLGLGLGLGLLGSGSAFWIFPAPRSLPLGDGPSSTFGPHVLALPPLPDSDQSSWFVICMRVRARITRSLSRASGAPSHTNHLRRRVLLSLGAYTFGGTLLSRAFAAPVVNTGQACSVSAAAAAPGNGNGAPMASSDYLGTAEARRLAGMERAKSLTKDQLSAPWTEVRRSLLWAAGLKDMTDVPPGLGNTSHCFNDFNHCDATTMA